MRFAKVLFLLPFLMFVSVPVQAAIAPLPPMVNDQGEPSLAPMLKKVLPAVVNIATQGVEKVQNPLMQDPFFRRFFNLPDMPQERKVESLGSGVIIDAKKGYIVTNNHVIANANQITVNLRDGRQFKAKLIGTDPASDIAVIQIKAHNLTALTISNSSKLEVGDYVVAIGNPFGLGQTVTSGIVSALGRTGLGIESYEDFIQTDAPINPGNSGGALVNIKGQLVGINTAILGPSGGNIGIGFAIPSNMVKDVMSQLIEYGQVRRGRLGVIAQNLTPELAKAFNIKSGTKGAVISQVEPHSSAAKAGLRAGDVVTGVNGQPVASASDLRNVVGLLRVGTEVRMQVLRDGKTRDLVAKIDQAATQSVDGGRVAKALSGLVLANIDADSPLHGKVKGVLIAGVDPSSEAAQVGLQKGDVITSVNKRAVTDIKELEAAARGTDGAVLLNIWRQGNSLFVVLGQ
ncbi:MAG: DegQ family serine endoprotease [Gammaproteobacteria bacterium]